VKPLVFLHFFDILDVEGKLFNLGGSFMKIELEGTLLKMTPENEREKGELNQLWAIIIDCVRENRKLVPVGEYVPGVKEVATFNIE
jgi:hypothetical protein